MRFTIALKIARRWLDSLSGHHRSQERTRRNGYAFFAPIAAASLLALGMASKARIQNVRSRLNDQLPTPLS